tara:strand:+ start:107 stop:400 length:294 start_codon:yes stop_codon:yes gene_type:complete
MAKNKKKDEVIDLKPENITELQLKNVQETVNNLNRLQIEIGIIETRKHHMLNQVSMIQDNITKLQKELEEEYGTSDINIQTGEIKYPKENGEVNKED